MNDITIETKQPGRFRRSWLLAKGAWHALRLDKELLSLPLIGFAVALPLLMLIPVIFLINPDAFITSSVAADGMKEYYPTTPAYAVLISIFALVAVVSTLISGAVAHGALERFRGNDPTVKGSLRAAWAKRGSLGGFALFSFGVGFILSEIANRIPYLGGKIVAWLGQAAWNVASFFAIPVIVSSEESVGPIKATKRSIGIIKQVWGESLILSVSIGVVTLVSILLYGLVVGVTAGLLGALGATGWVFAPLAVIAFLGLIGLILVFSMLDAFIKVAIYYYATTGVAPATFNQNLLKAAFTPKKARKIFG